MQLFNKILAVLNPGSRPQVALDRALHIAHHSNGEVCALVLKHKATEAFITEIDIRLAQAATKGFKVSFEISEEHDLLRAIQLNQHRAGFDLIVKEPHPASLTDSLFTPRDWKLLRTNASPVLMARSGNLDEQAPVLAAIEVQPSDTDHQQLSACILAKADYIAHRLGVPLHIFSAYPAPMQDPSGNHAPTEVDSYHTACLALTTPLAIPSERVHTAEGPAELVLPEQSKALGAQLLVIGSVARKGLQGALLGNTAEQVLECVHCDVLVIGSETSL